MQLISYPINNYFRGTFNNILLLRNMMTVKQTVFILFFGIISLTTSRATNILREEDWNGPSPEIMENPFRKFLDGTSIHIPMDEEMDEHATGDDNDQLPALADDEKTIPVFIMKKIIISIVFPNNPTNDTMDPPANNDSVNNSALLGSKDSTKNGSDDPTVIYLRPQPRTLSVPGREFYECVSCMFIMKKIQISIEFPNNPTNDTMDPPANNDSVNNSALGSKDSTNNVTDDPTVIYLRPHPRTLTVPGREFYECVSCNSDFRARNFYDVCLQKLSLKNQEIIQSCCNVSFDSDFCSKAYAGKINYKTICEDPEKALMVGHCFWRKIEDKETDDIKMYRECKREILYRYCAVTSSAESE